MTETEIKRFRVEFRKIVSIKDWLLNNKKYLTQLHKWDKNGSHTKVINDSLKRRDDILKQYNLALKGKTYEEWKATGKAITQLLIKIKRTEVTLDNAKSSLNKLTF